MDSVEVATSVVVAAFTDLAAVALPASIIGLVPTAMVALFAQGAGRYGSDPLWRFSSSIKEGVIAYRTRRLLKSSLSPLEKSRQETELEAEDFFKGAADFDYSVATLADLVKVVESDLEVEKDSEEGRTPWFLTDFAVHTPIINRLKKLDATLTTPLKPAVAAAAREGILRYRKWKPQAHKAWEECYQFANQGQNQLEDFLFSGISTTKFAPYYARLLALEKQTLASMTKASNFELAGEKASSVSYSDLMKGKVTCQ